MKLWKKDNTLDKEVEKFTVGNDYFLDNRLVAYDCLSSIAHAKMLQKIGVLSKKEAHQIIKGLDQVIRLHKQNKFRIAQEDEDSHTAIENYLIKKIGNAGKKIHIGRSRNDQVLTALRLYEKDKLQEIRGLLSEFKSVLKRVIAKDGKIKLPGYSHMRKAMPTTIKVWLGSFASSATDNLRIVDFTMHLVDQSPLGSAAGFGVPVFHLDRQMTARLMGLSKVLDNPLHCQLTRGKFESTVIHALAQILFDLNKLSTDLIIFSMSELGFVSLPGSFCTGSSIMPHKKNSDVLELIRSKYHVVVAEEFKMHCLVGNLMSGYNRDLQLTKEPLFNSFDITKDCLKMISAILPKIRISKTKCEAAITEEMFSTEQAYALSKNGLPFRDAYAVVAKQYTNPHKQSESK